jgi:hypothetical protein
MTIRQTLESWRLERLKILESAGAPAEVVEAEKATKGFDYVEGIDLYGDLEVKEQRLLATNDEGLFPVIIFECKRPQWKHDIFPVLMFTKDTTKDTDKKSTFETSLVRLAWSI